MFHVSRFTPDPSRFGEFLACLWQGEVPASLVLSKWLYLPGEPRAMLILWEGDAVARDYVERAFGGFGTLETDQVTDVTPGLAAALARDLDGFGRVMQAQGATPEAIDTALDVRRRGMNASTQADAAAAGRAWMAEQSQNS
ncbi:MAG: hypothetical protein ACHQDE_00245 [Acidimicrobiia bacterium]